MNRAERMKEIAKEYPDFGKGVGYKMCMIDELEVDRGFERRKVKWLSQEKMN